LVERGNTWARLSNLPPQTVAAVDAATSYATAQVDTGGWRPPEAVMGEEVWDGWVHLARFPAPGVALVPAGLLELAQAALASTGVQAQVVDHRVRTEPGVPDPATIPLRPYQRAAVAALMDAGQGVLDMPPRSGKTRTAIEAVRQVALPALWIVPTLNIGKQTQAAAEEFMGRNWAVFVSGNAAAEEAAGAPVVIVTPNTAAALSDAFYATRKVLVMDECHHQAASTWRTISNRTPHIWWRWGMSGTFFRSGEDDLAMRAVLSRVVYRVTAQELVDMGNLVTGDVVFLPVLCALVPSSPGKSFQAGVGAKGIFRNDFRSQLAAWAAASLCAAGKRTVVLVGTKEQGRTITEALEAALPRDTTSPWKAAEFISTDRPSKVCQDVLAAFTAGNGVRVLIGTSMIGEGTDLPTSDALVYAMGGKAEVSHTQAAYRVITAVPGKRRAIIVDFADRHNPTLLRHSEERLRTYVGQPVFRTHVLQQVEEFQGWLQHGETFLPQPTT
jgi:superfamily II DNA or RNA helicase